MFVYEERSNIEYKFHFEYKLISRHGRVFTDNNGIINNLKPLMRATRCINNNSWSRVVIG